MDSTKEYDGNLTDDLQYIFNDIKSSTLFRSDERSNRVYLWASEMLKLVNEINSNRKKK